MDHYEVLGVAKNASREDIKKAYRKKAKQSHPDAGGDSQTFAMIALAYETLEDDEKRKRYDETGEDGPKGNEIHQAVSSILVEAFMQPDPITYICDRFASDRSNISSNLANAKIGLTKLCKALEKFKQKNKKTQNPEARDFIVSVLEGQIDIAEHAMRKNEQNMQFCTDCIAYVNNLYREGKGAAGFNSSRPGPVYAEFRTQGGFNPGS